MVEVLQGSKVDLYKEVMRDLTALLKVMYVAVVQIECNIFPVH